MSTETAAYKRNLESSILFMQKEHAATIKGLHEEIYSLQKRCTDLTFQLTVQGLTIDEPDATNDKMQELQRDLDLSKAKISILEKQLRDRDKRIELLETEARSQRKLWIDESRAQLQTMNSQRAELEAKANNIAYLTLELHRLKVKNKVQQTNVEGNSKTPTVENHLDVSTYAGHIHANSKTQYHHHHFLPVPPKDKMVNTSAATTRVRRSNYMKSALEIGYSGRPVIAVHPSSANVQRGGQQHRNHHFSGSGSSGSNSPDITAFLPQTRENNFPLLGVKQPQVLPPIATNSSAPNSAEGSAQSIVVHSVRSSPSQLRQTKSSPPKAGASVVTLALGNAAASDAWTFAQGSKSSEYN